MCKSLEASERFFCFFFVDCLAGTQFGIDFRPIINPGSELLNYFYSSAVLSRGATNTPQVFDYSFASSKSLV